MPTILSRVLAFLERDEGPTAVEYAIMLALILVVLMSAITTVGNSTAGVWSSDVNQLSNAMS